MTLAEHVRKAYACREIAGHARLGLDRAVTQLRHVVVLNPLFKGPFATTKPSNIYCTKLHARNLAMVFTISLPECVGLTDCVWCSKLTTPSRSSYPLVLLTAVGGYWLNFWQVSGFVALLCRWY